MLTPQQTKDRREMREILVLREENKDLKRRLRACIESVIELTEHAAKSMSYSYRVKVAEMVSEMKKAVEELK